MVDRREIKTNLTIISHSFKYLYLKEREQKTIKHKMSIKRTIITTIVALALVAVVAPVATQATTVSDLMAQIQALQAQLQGLSGSTSTTTTSGNLPAACVGVTFSRNLVVGSVGSDVKCLQAILNMNAATRVATTGAGAPGYETTTFGPRTLVAVRAWQVAAGFTPANQIGPMSRAKLNAWLGGSSSTTTTTTTTTGTTATGAVSAMVSADNPASGAIVNGQASADLLHVAFTGTGVVTSVTLQRSGISDQNALTNVYLYDGNVRITDGYSFNISGQLVMNGLSIAVNGSHVISVRGDVATATSPITESSIVVTMTSFTAGSAMTSNVMGNSMQIVAGNLATATIGTQTVGTANVNAGTTQYTFWSAPLQVNTRSVMLKVANFRMIGSAPSDALSNIALYVDGINTGKTATVQAINGSNYATFDLTSAPLTLTTGSHTIDMRADVQKGTNRNITVSIQQASDLTVTDPQVGVNIAVSGTPSSAGTITILTGSVTVNTSSAFTAMTNVSGGATNSVIGQFTVHAYGEDVKVLSVSVTPAMTTTGTATASGITTVSSGVITGVTFNDVNNGGLGYVAAPTVSIAQGTCSVAPTATANISGGKIVSLNITANGTSACTAGAAITFGAPSFSTVGGLNNVTLYFNGSQIGSQQNWPVTGGALTYQLGSQMIIPAGQDSKFEVRADLQTTTNISYTAGTVGTIINAGTGNAQGQSSQNTVSFPTAPVTTNTLAIQSGLLQVAANPGFLGQSIAPNTTGARIGSFIIQNQSTSESIRLTSLNLATTDSGTNGINNLAALRTSDTTGSGSTPIQPTGTDSFSVNDTLAPGAQMTLDIFANTGSDASGNVQVKLTVQSIGTVDNISTTSSQKTGQVMVLGTGTVGTPSLIVGSTTQTQFIAAAGGATNASQATYNFVSSNGAATVTELKFNVTGSDATPSQSVTNICIGSVCASPVAGVADLTNLSIAVPNGGGGSTQNVQVSYTSVGTGGIAPSTSSLISLAYVKFQSGGGSTQTITPTVNANTVYLVGSKPTLAINQGGAAAGLIASGATNKIGQVTVSADPKGNIKVNTIAFNVGTSGFSTATVLSPFLVNGTSGSVAISSITCTVNGTDSVITCATNGTQTNPTLYSNDYAIAAGQSQIFSLYATVSGSVTAGATASVSTTLSSSGFKWDDTSLSGLGGAGVDDQLTGTNIYGFPSDSWSIHQ